MFIVLPQGLSLGGKIYTVTECSADRTIALYNENSYSNLRPTKIFFFSVIVAAEGGETPIADRRKWLYFTNIVMRRKSAT